MLLLTENHNNKLLTQHANLTAVNSFGNRGTHKHDSSNQVLLPHSVEHNEELYYYCPELPSLKCVTCCVGTVCVHVCILLLFPELISSFNTHI